MPDNKNKTEAQTFLRRYGDITDRNSRAHIARLAFLLASVLILLAAVSLVFVGHFASQEANRQARANQQSLLKTALDTKFILIARDQRSLARWDKAVRKISLRLDEDFVIDEFIDSLWFDFGLDRNLLIRRDDRIIAESHGPDVVFTGRTMDSENPLYRLVELARKQYFQNRIELDGGFGQRPVPFAEEFTNPVYGFVEMEGKVAMVHGMAVVPDDGSAVLPEGKPVVLLSALYVDKELVKELNEQLSFSRMHFQRPEAPAAANNYYTILSPEGKPIGVFSWQAHLPGRDIWETIIPVIGMLSTILGMVALAIAYKIGKLTVSLAKSEKQNRHLAMYDNLSGLANRLQYSRALDDAVGQLPAIPFALIQCDLDKFKQVNDTHGHGAGDIVIKEVAKRLTDCVGEAGLVCRIGGDEFVIVLGLIDRAAIEALTGRIIEEINKPIEVAPNIHARVGVSLGIGFAPAHGNSGEDIMAAADEALYRAKEEGRNRAVFYEDHVDGQDKTTADS